MIPAREVALIVLIFALVVLVIWALRTLSHCLFFGC